MKQWSDMTARERNAALAHLIGDDLPYTTSLDAMWMVEDEIRRRGLVEQYQDALIEILGLDMRVFNSAIELDPHVADVVADNRFQWEGHACLWLFLHATPVQRAEAAYRVLKDYVP